jgi:hypothetical protein
MCTPLVIISYPIRMMVELGIQAVMAVLVTAMHFMTSYGMEHIFWRLVIKPASTAQTALHGQQPVLNLHP